MVKTYQVYVCRNDHINYANERPKKCSTCRNPVLNLVYGVQVTMDESELEQKKEQVYDEPAP